jgi:hypothetical protein
MHVVARILSYAAACATVVGVLWLAVVTRPDAALRVAWIVADVLSLVVTWRVATRDGRNRVLWVATTVLVGPLAWIAMAASDPRSSDAATT